MLGKCYYNLLGKRSGGRNKNSAYAEFLDSLLPRPGHAYFDSAL